MAKSKKTRRAKQRRARPVRRLPPRPTAPQKAAPPETVSFAQEYQYVVADLKRIFVLAGGMLALLGVLALILR